ncbi:MAG TPA: type II toxin-antitoxin system HicB family antitoxin [Chloroflexia bacterium]|jgi:predicted RNase H-like HicB family nuclease
MSKPKMRKTVTSEEQDAITAGITEYHHRYSMIVEWSDEDNVYIVTVPELSGCRTHGATREEAVRQGQDAIDGWIESAQADGEVVPAPKTFSYWSPFLQAVEVDAAQSSPVKS